MTGPAAVAPVARPDANVFVPSASAPKKPSRKKAWLALLLIPLLAIGAVVAWPLVAKWLDPRPIDPAEQVAYDYLKACQKNDMKTMERLAVVEDHPALRSFRELKRDHRRDATLKGSFAPIAALNRKIEQKYDYDQASGRFTPKDQLGPAAETLDALHEAKAKLEREGTYDKIAGGTPEEQMQAALDLGGALSKLSVGTLAPRKLIPSYKMLIQDARPPLPPVEKSLALDYASHREVWDGLLRRPFPTIKADGAFVFDHAEVEVETTDPLGSSGDPPTPMRLKLVRFRLDAIDTRWKVVSVRRVVPGMPLDEPDPQAEPENPPSPEKPSPGDLGITPGIQPDPTPRR
jgi:hypothetical protein